MRKGLVIAAALMMSLTMGMSVPAAEVIVGGEVINTEDLTGEQKTLYEEYAAELEQMKDIGMAGSIYDTEGFSDYYDLYLNTCILGVKQTGEPEITQELVDEMKSLREALVPTGEAKEDVIWYIWGDEIPTEEGAEDYNFNAAADDSDFVPYICAYLVEDQSEAKGNILVCSGGADLYRSHNNEGNPTCAFFNSIGYNAFLVNYRVSPYASVDATLDVQRAVRYLLYHGEEYGIGALDKISTMGYSAGAMHCYGQAIAFSGTITPDSVYPDYKCDEIDQVEADVDASIIVYAAGMPHDTKGSPVDISAPVMLLEDGDPNKTEELPAFFFAGASGHFASGFCVQAYSTLNPLTECELHMYAGIDGPFGLGTEYEGSDQMRDQIEAFLDVEFGYRTRVKN